MSAPPPTGYHHGQAAPASAAAQPRVGAMPRFVPQQQFGPAGSGQNPSMAYVLSSNALGSTMPSVIRSSAAPSAAASLSSVQSPTPVYSHHAQLAAGAASSAARSATASPSPAAAPASVPQPYMLMPSGSYPPPYASSSAATPSSTSSSPSTTPSSSATTNSSSSSSSSSTSAASQPHASYMSSAPSPAPSAASGSHGMALIAQSQAHRQQELQNVATSESAAALFISDKLRKLVRDSLPADEELTPFAERVLIDIAEEFIASVTTFGCSLAKHRKSDTLDVCDLQLHLQQSWNIDVPGFVDAGVPPVATSAGGPLHQKRLLVLQKHQAAKKKRRR